MSLNTGRLIHRRQFQILPITDEVIRRVHEIAKRGNQLVIDNGELLVEWRLGLPINMVNDDE